MTWRSPELKCLDLRYASLDPREGLFLQLAAAGHVEAMPSAERIERFVNEPPDETRAYLRAHLLRRFGEDVMDMLTTLNEQGATILMVTHSPSHAGRAHRLINLVDGRIVPNLSATV